jgi:hypothetical protein
MVTAEAHREAGGHEDSAEVIMTKKLMDKPEATRILRRI